MTAVFAKILLMGLSAGILVAVVLVLRLFTGKVSKKLTCLLWALVAVRLVCPVSLQTPFSLMPTLPAVTEFAEPTAAPVITPADPAPAVTVDPVTPVSPATPATTATPTKTASPVSLLTLFAAVWLAGMVSLLLYGVLSAFLVRRRMLGAVRKEDNVWQSDRVGSPFILGVLRPRIYLPFTLSETATAAVLAHERTHLKRGDHLVKPLAWLLLSVYWFNPLLWVAYILLCRDIESACDEKVVKGMEEEERKAYATALLDCGISQSRRLAVCPLAFGEVKVKQRVRDVMNYRRPAFWLILVAVLLTLTAAVFFLTDRAKTPKDPAPSEGLEFIMPDPEQGYLLYQLGTCTDRNIVVPSEYEGKPVVGVYEKAFCCCETVETLWFSEGMEFIGEEAFQGCPNLREIHFPTTMKEIRPGAFSSCFALEKTDFQKNLTTITNAFTRCDGLTEVTLPASIKELTGAFVGSAKLERITFRADDPVLGAQVAAYALPALKEITFPCEKGKKESSEHVFLINADKKSYSLAAARNGSIPSSYNGKPVTGVGAFVFGEQSDVSFVCLPKSVTKIGAFAFSGCRMLETFEAPGAEEIGISAFQDCVNLSSVLLGEKLDLGMRAFYRCVALNEFPTERIVKMGREVFSVCPVGETLDYPGKAFLDEERQITFALTDDLAGWSVRLGKNYYREASNVTIPASYEGRPVTELRQFAVPQINQTVSLTLPASIRTIEKNAITMFGGKITFLGTKAQWNAVEKEEGWLVGFAERIVCSDGDEEPGRASAVLVPGEGIAVPVSAELIRAATFTDFNTERVLTGEEIKRLAVLFAGSEVIDLDGGTTPDYRLDISFTDGTSMTLYDCEDRLEVVFFDEKHAVLGEEDAEYKLINDGLVDFLKGFLNE